MYRGIEIQPEEGVQCSKCMYPNHQINLHSK